MLIAIVALFRALLIERVRTWLRVAALPPGRLSFAQEWIFNLNVKKVIDYRAIDRYRIRKASRVYSDEDAVDESRPGDREGGS